MWEPLVHLQEFVCVTNNIMPRDQYSDFTFNLKQCCAKCVQSKVHTYIYICLKVVIACVLHIILISSLSPSTTAWSCAMWVMFIYYTIPDSSVKQIISCRLVSHRLCGYYCCEAITTFHTLYLHHSKVSASSNRLIDDTTCHQVNAYVRSL